MGYLNTSTSWVISDRARRALTACELFRDLDMRQLMGVAALVEEVSIEPGELLLCEDGAARHVYVVFEGRGVAQLGMYRGILSLGFVGPSDVAGWSALVGALSYPASVRAITRMEVIRMHTEGMALLMELDPLMASAINRRLSLIFYRQYQASLEALKAG